MTEAYVIERLRFMHRTNYHTAVTGTRTMRSRSLEGSGRRYQKEVRLHRPQLARVLLKRRTKKKHLFQRISSLMLGKYAEEHAAQRRPASAIGNDIREKPNKQGIVLHDVDMR